MRAIVKATLNGDKDIAVNEGEPSARCLADVMDEGPVNHTDVADRHHRGREQTPAAQALSQLRESAGDARRHYTVDARYSTHV